MEGVSAVNEVVTLFSTLREICRSLTQRVDNYRGNRQQLVILKDELTNAEQKIHVCSETLESYCNAISTESLKFAAINLKGMVNSMQHVREIVDELEEAQQRRRRFRAFRRANRTAEDISFQVGIVRDIGSQLNDMNKELMAFARENDLFTPDFSSVPNTRVPVYLDFTRTDTMEGEVKEVLLKSVEHSERNVPTAYFHVTAVVGVAGMGGVGKTTALIGLAQQEEVQEKFSSGGIHFLVVGKDATPGSLVAALKEIVSRSGGKKRCKEIDSDGPLESAVRTTSSWFAGRRALFILDDLWQTASSRLGYFEELIGLIDKSPDSHVVLSTRSNIIASEASERIEFKPRENTGYEARRIFLATARLDENMTHDSECMKLAERVLELCGGVPLLLSIAGAQVRRRRGLPMASLKRLLRSLEKTSLLEKQPEHYPKCFNQAVEASIDTIADELENAEEFKKQWDTYCRNESAGAVRTVIDLVMDCFRRLCILPQSARVSDDFIFGIWGNTYWSILNSLCDFHLVLEFEDTEGNMKYGLHDVVLEYCEQASRFGQNSKYELYHREFLKHAWEIYQPEPSSGTDVASAETQEDCDRALSEFWLPGTWAKSRPWWRILTSSEELSELDSYLLQNLFRHLKESGRLGEAVGLVSHMGWTKLRVKHGGINALNADFSFVTHTIEEHRGKDEDHEECDDALHGMMDIWNMVGRAWSAICKNPDGLATHAYGHLMDNEKKLPLAERYLGTGSDILNGPWFKPKSAFWRVLHSSSGGRAFRTAEQVIGVAFGSKNIIAATENMLFWIDKESMTAKREMVVRNIGSDSGVSAFCLCESQGIVVLGLHSGELELHNERNGNIIGEPLHGHESLVRGVGISGDGRTVVSCSADSAIRLWDVCSSTQIGDPLSGHEGELFSVGISGDGRTAVSGSDDGTVRLWDVQSASQIGHPLRGHEDTVSIVDISRDGRIAVSGSDDWTVRLWDVRSATQIGDPLRGHGGGIRSVRISVDGRTVVSGSGDRTIRLWDVRTAAQIGDPLRGHESWVYSVGISRDGRTVVSGSFDTTVRMWDVWSATQMKNPPRGHADYVNSVGVSGDGQTVVSGSLDKTVRLWDLETATPIGDPLYGHECGVRSVGISGDGQTVVSGSDDGTVRLWDVETATQIRYPLRGHEHSVLSVGISGDGRTVVSGSYDRTVRLWDVRSSTQIGDALRGHEGEVLCVGISEDGQTVVSSSVDRTVRLWDVRNATQIRNALRGHEGDIQSVGISGDGRTVVSGSNDGTVRLWNARTATQIGDPLRGHVRSAYGLRISRDGRTLVFRSGNGTVHMWSRNSCGSSWKHSCACSLPVSLGVPALGFFDGDTSCGEVEKLFFPMLGAIVVLELVRP